MRPRLLVAALAAALCASCTVESGGEGRAVGAASSPGAASETANEVQRMQPVLAGTNLGRAVQSAIAGGPTLRSGRAGEDAAQSGVEGARSALRPETSIGVRAGVSTSEDGQITPELRLNQLLFDGGATRNRILAAEARVESASAQTVEQVTNRTFEAVSAWEELHLARQLETISREAVVRYGGFEEQIARRVNAGAGRNAELLRVESRLNEAQAELARNQGSKRSAEARVLEIFGTLPAVGALPGAPAPASGFGRNPAVAELRAEVAAAEADLAASRAARNPAVIFEVVGDLDESNDPSLGTGLRLDYDLGTNGQRQAAIARSEAELERLEADLQLVEQQVARAAAQALSRESALVVEREAAVSSEEAAREALEDARQGFSGGRFDIFDLLDLGRDLDRAAIRRAEVEAALRVAGYNRLAVSGDLIDVFGISLGRDPR